VEESEPKAEGEQASKRPKTQKSRVCVPLERIMDIANIMMSGCKTFMPSRLHAAFFLLILLTHHHGGLFLFDSSSSFFLAEAAPKRRKDGNPLSRSVSVYNKAAAKIDIFWIHPTTQELAPSNTNGDGIVFGAMSGVLSYVGHQFEVQEIPNPKTGKCKYEECRKAYFTCSQEENQGADVCCLLWCCILLHDDVAEN
jgi:hypothetical protein